MTALDDLLDRIQNDRGELEALGIAVLGCGDGARPSLRVTAPNAEAATQELRSRYGPGIEIEVVEPAP